MTFFGNSFFADIIVKKSYWIKVLNPMIGVLTEKKKREREREKEKPENHVKIQKQ